MEVYSVEMNHLLFEERAKLNYDAPHATEVHLLERHIRDYARAKRRSKLPSITLASICG